jgi:hypothetical protein
MDEEATDSNDPLHIYESYSISNVAVRNKLNSL